MFIYYFLGFLSGRGQGIVLSMKPCWFPVFSFSDSLCSVLSSFLKVARELGTQIFIRVWLLLDLHSLLSVFYYCLSDT